MSRFEIEERVLYLPDHAEGPDHEDAEVGVVTGVGPPTEPDRSRQYWVDYDDGSGVSKCTYERNLYTLEDQGVGNDF